MKINLFRLLMTTMLIGLMTLPQETSAKKIEYLGHIYNGKVNSQKIPEGYGELRIKDVVISGTFADRTVTDAVVAIDNKVEGAHCCKFNGTVKYDESDNITLKAGGKLTIKYAEKEISPYKDEQGFSYNLEVLEDVLSIDFKASPEFFGVPNYKRPILNISKGIVKLINFIGYDVNAFNIPSNMWAYETFKFTLGKYGIWNRAKQRAERIEWYLIREGESERYPSGAYNDKTGRTWEYSCSNELSKPYGGGIVKRSNSSLTGFTVRYQNGDYFKIGHYAVEWKKKYNDGKEVTVKMDCYQSGNNCDCNPAMATFAGFKVALGKNRLFELWNSNDFALDQSDVKGIDIDGVYTNTPSKDVENKIKKNLFPYLSNNGTGFGFEVYASGSRYGNFKNGRITSNVYQEQQQEAAQNMRKIQKEYDEGCKKYGKQNYDAFLKGKVIVGMPEELILRYNNELAQQVGPRKMYRLYDGNMWHPKVVYTVWVVNGKVSSFRYYR